MVGRHEHAVLEQAQLSVGVARCGDELPAVELLALGDEHGIALEADEGPVDVAGADQLLGDLARHAVGEEPLRDPLGPVGVPPDELALRVVERALVHRRPRQLRDVGGGADVVGMEVRDEDAGDLGPVERGRPHLLRIGEADPGVDERPAVVARKQVRVDVPRPGRQRRRDPADPVRELHRRIQHFFAQVRNLREQIPNARSPLKGRFAPANICSIL